MIFAQFYEQHSEIGAAEVQRQELSVLYKKKKTVTSFGIKKSVVGRNSFSEGKCDIYVHS
jgi:hypothetical protein